MCNLHAELSNNSFALKNLTFKGLGWKHTLTHPTYFQGSRSPTPPGSTPLCQIMCLFVCQACAPCDPECRTCTAGPHECEGDCVHFVEEDRCVAVCSASRYVTGGGQQCLKCHASCANCTGPTPADCVFCRHYFLFDDFVNRHQPGATVRTSAEEVVFSPVSVCLSVWSYIQIYTKLY